MSKDLVLVSLLLTLNRFHSKCSNVFIVELEQVNAGWAEMTEMPAGCKSAHNAYVES